MTLTPRPLYLLLACFALGLCAPAQPRQDPPAQPAQDAQPSTIEEVQARLAELQASELPDKGDLVAVYGQALVALENAKRLELKAADFERQAEAAPKLLENIRQGLAQPPAKEDPPVSPEALLRELEQELQQAEANRTAAQKIADDLAGEAKYRTERTGDLADDIARVRTQISERESELRATSVADATGLARHTFLQAEFAALRAEQQAFLSERKNYEARRELLPLRRDEAQRNLVRAEQLVQFWQQRVTLKRQKEAEQADRDARKRRLEIADRFPELSKIAKRNEQLASLRSGGEGISAQIGHASSELLAAPQLRDETARRFRATRRKVQVGGLTEGMGLLLLREYKWSRSPKALENESKNRLGDLSRAQLLQIELQEEREDIGDIAVRHSRLMATLGALSVDTGPEQLSTIAKELLTDQRQLHDTLIDELGLLIGKLIDLERVNQELLDSTVAYRRYIEERILWVRSTTGAILPSFADAWSGLAWLVTGKDTEAQGPAAALASDDRSEWPKGLQKSLAAAGEELEQCLVLAVAILGLLLFRRRIRTALIETANMLRSYRTDRFSHTLVALAQTIALALPLPLLAWTIGWFLSLPEQQVEVANSVGLGLRDVAFRFFVLEFLRQTTMERHLGQAHFRWHRSSARALRRELRWFLPLAVTLECLVLVFIHQSAASLSESSLVWNDATGRIAFICLLAATTTMLFRLFRRNSELLAEHYRRTSSVLERTQRLWHVLLIGTPAALIVLALAGYYYTALLFEIRLHDSLGLALLLIFVNGLLLRWLFIERRRLAVEQARQRASAKAQASAAAEGALASESGSVSFDEEGIDIPAVDAQTRKLFRSGIIAAALLGMFFIWADAFPALRALDRVQLYPRIHLAAANVSPIEDLAQPAPPSANGSANSPAVTGTGGAPTAAVTGDLPSGSSEKSSSETEPQNKLPSVITLADLLLALVIFLLTLIATKNAPGVLEISILPRLPLDSGARYALSTLFRYLILFVGFSAGFGAIGIGWDTFRWLAAAAALGLGFGLQEIFANFVSGIIILIERPIRVGDVVSVGETEGRVTRLRMRATTILDWNRRELLVPNKEFITGSVVNWTLSDPITRLIVPVGIAYGSDTKLAHSLLMKVAKECELVLDEPAPSAIFRKFGDSSLEFELRVFLANRDLWPVMVDRLHTQIDDAFRAAGIEIAFPQRDLHIRSAEGLRGLGSALRETPAPTKS